MSDLLARARISAETATSLLKAGDHNGAISRAYYAMFDQARAELRKLDPKLIETKTHATILRRFSKHLVKEHGLPPELGRLLRGVFDARLGTEYALTIATAEEARAVVAAMEQFLAKLSHGEESKS